MAEGRTDRLGFPGTPSRAVSRQGHSGVQFLSTPISGSLSVEYPTPAGVHSRTQIFMKLPTLLLLPVLVAPHLLGQSPTPRRSDVLISLQPPAPSKSTLQDASGRTTGRATTTASGTTTSIRMNDASGRSEGTIRSTPSGSTTRSTVTDPSGRTVGRATTSTSSTGSSVRFEDASGRLEGRSQSRVSGNTVQTTFTDASGRTVGRSTTTMSKDSSSTRVQDASGRSLGTVRTTR